MICLSNWIELIWGVGGGGGMVLMSILVHQLVLKSEAITNHVSALSLGEVVT